MIPAPGVPQVLLATSSRMTGPRNRCTAVASRRRSRVSSTVLTQNRVLQRIERKAIPTRGVQRVIEMIGSVVILGLAMQVAFVIPVSIPVIGAAALYNVDWFYPAFMVIVGAHYLPFVFLYGMRAYAVLAGVLIAGGVTIGYLLPDTFSIGGWFGGAVLLLFALVVWHLR